MTFCDGLSIGVNVSLVLLILLLGFLFSLPLKLMMMSEDATDTRMSFSDDNKSESDNRLDYRELKMCENLGYSSLIKSVFLICDHDENCTTVSGQSKPPIVHQVEKLNDRDGPEYSIGNTERRNLSASQRKSASIAGHILSLLLVLSAIVALVEVLRVRFFDNKRSDGNGVHHQGARKFSSVVDSTQRRRHVRKDTVQAQKSFEIQRMMHRSPLRLLAARPPPLLRRSSFPAQCISAKDFPNSTGMTTTTGRLSRRPSFLVDSEEDSNYLTDFKRHARLIRRH